MSVLFTIVPNLKKKIQMSIRRKMAKHTVVYLYNGILLSKIKE